MTPTSAANDAAKLGARLTYGTTPCVLVVDLAEAFTRSDHPLGADLGSVVTETRRLADAARERGVLVVYTTIAFREDLSDAGIWPQKAPSLTDLITGRASVMIDERLGRRSEEPIVQKQGTSAFFGTTLIALLVSSHIDTVILCGASTSGCIRATAVDCLQYGLPTLIPSECVGDRSHEAHVANLRDLDAKYADVAPLEEVLTYLQTVSPSCRTVEGGPE